MATVDVTVEEIEGAPLLINPTVKEVKPTTRSRLNLALCIILAINMLLQLIAMVTPGWNVQRTVIGSRHESVYYSIVCTDTTPLENISTTVCHTWTFLDDFSKLHNAAKDSKKPALVGAYNLRVRYQINIQISWIIVAGATIFQIIRYIRATEAYSRITAINAMILICACSAMYQSLYEAIVTLDVTSRQAEYLSVEVGFPYSLLMYAVAFMQTCACTVVIVKQLYDYTLHIQLALKETKVQVDTLQKQLEAEIEEFRRYRHRQSEKSYVRGRSRKSSKHVDRNSKRDKSLHKQYSSEKGNSDGSVVNSEGDQIVRNIELLDIFSTPKERPYNRHDRNDSVSHECNISRRTSDVSDISRDSSAYSRNHHHSRHAPHKKSIQQTSQPQRLKPGTRKEQNIQTRMRDGYSSPKQSNNGNSIELIADNDVVSNINDMKMEKLTRENHEVCEKTSDDKTLRKDKTRRTVSADVHIPSIDVEVTED